MSILELRRKKEETEKAIENIIRDFEKETSCRVNDISDDISEVKGYDGEIFSISHNISISINI